MITSLQFRHLLSWAIFGSLATSLFVIAEAQDFRDLKPVVGLRENTPADVLLDNAILVRGPEFYSGKGDLNVDSAVGDVLIRDGVMVEVGDSIEPPAGCRVIDCKGKRLYAGWINAWHEVSKEDATPAKQVDDYWNANITPLRKINEVQQVPAAAKLRSQGFTTTVLAPPGRILGGQPSVWSLNEKKANNPGPQRITETRWMTAALTVPRPNDAGESYPRSPMGAYALLRQSLYDAQWYGSAVHAYQAKKTLPRPNANASLAELSSSLPELTLVFDCPNERMILRAQRIMDEFSVRGIMRGSGREYRDLDGTAKATRTILLPLDFSAKPNVATPQQAREVELRELLHWKFSPSNPAKLIQRGVSVCLTTDRLKDVGKFLPNLRKAVDHGLSRQDAIASLTTVPAKLLGIEQTFGRIETGMLANLVLTDGDLFEKKTKISNVYVAGQEFEITKDATTPWNGIVGSWDLPKRKKTKQAAHLEIKQTKGRVSVKLVVEDGVKGKSKKKKMQKGKDEKQGKDKKADQKERKQDKESDSKVKEGKSDEVSPEKQEKKTNTVDLKEITQGSDQITGLMDFGESIKGWCNRISLPLGKHRVSIRSNERTLADVGENSTLSLDIYPIGAPRVTLKVTRKATKKESPSSLESESDSKLKNGDPNEQPKNEADEQPAIVQTDDPITIVHPLGAYGRQTPVKQPSQVLFRNALVWTCEDRKDLPIPTKTQDVLVEDGKITRIDQHISIDDVINQDTEEDDDCLIVDARGQHMTPGLIDCHSHIATDGGINEGGQVVTAEVRVGDFLDPSDITIYRQLAGGVTTANILHGSANPIGGQNQVIKFRWGDPMDDLRFQDAPAGIKFALGENVKRSSSRYPNTRMGVEQLLRDQFLAAREYKRDHRRWNSGIRESLPPRVDLQMEALAEVQDGKRWIHCHSYRQDEIVATLDVLDEFGIRIGSLQHILEGYKVADRMARHGAMASSFADWWAYKFEVYDAIPYNGAVMHNAGIVVSFNSDDWELGRHLNTEAAKAVKYGGVLPTEALKFVTLNPAKQLRIEDKTGSIEVGKDADLVLWNGPPLSTTSRCQQTWIDGRQMFDVDDDTMMRERDQLWRNQLVQSILDGESKAKEDPKTKDDAKKAEVDEEDRWLRYDEFCNTRGGQQDVQRRNIRVQNTRDQKDSQNWGGSR